MSWLSRFSLAQRALIGLMSIVALVFGAIAIPQLKQQLLPTIELPMVSVLAPYQGASPDVVEKQVVEPLENSIKAVDGVTGITSTASEGNAVIMATFDFGDEGTKQLVADIQQAVNRSRAQLPEDVDPQVIGQARPTTSRPSSSPSPPTRTSRRSPTSWTAPSSPPWRTSTASARSPSTGCRTSRSPSRPTTRSSRRPD